MVEFYKSEHLQQCVDLFAETYNRPPWNNRWTAETATRHLQEIMSHSRFVGFVLWDKDEMIGAALCYEKTWWSNDELYIHEFFIAPRFQRKGHGNTLFSAIEIYAEEQSLSNITLLTDRKKPAFGFYKKNGMAYLKNPVLMYKLKPGKGL